MELATKVNGLQGLNVPWHLKAAYQLFGPDGKETEKGTCEEWRVNAQQYRIALQGPTQSKEEYGTDHGTFRTGDRGWLRRPLSSTSATALCRNMSSLWPFHATPMHHNIGYGQFGSLRPGGS
jgi:hypothetical protein